MKKMKSNADFPKKADVYSVELTMGEIITLGVILGTVSQERVAHALASSMIDAPSYILNEAERYTGNVYQQFCDLVEKEYQEESITL